MSTTGSGASTTAIEPWLNVPDAREASDFGLNAFGAVEAYRLDDDDGRPVVARLSIDGAAFWIQGDAEASPIAPGVGSVRMILSVEDPDDLFEPAVDAGAAAVAPVHDEHGWRTGRLTDPFGHDWEVSRRL